MLISHARRITFRGKSADLRVLRNDGYCWGLLVDGVNAFDVSTRRDHYGRIDEDALDAFERAARNPKCIEPSVREWDATLCSAEEVENA